VRDLIAAGVAESPQYSRDDLVELESQIRKLSSTIAQNEYMCNTRYRQWVYHPKGCHQYGRLVHVPVRESAIIFLNRDLAFALISDPDSNPMFFKRY
jgi:hypothetical protein